MARALGVEVIVKDDEYDPQAWLRRVAFREENRCLLCHQMRLERTLNIAKNGNFDVFSTTLLYSRFQKHEQIRDLGRDLAAGGKTGFLYHDWRKDWDEGVQSSREMGLYRQQYCGCIYSEVERYRRECLPPKKRRGRGQGRAQGGAQRGFRGVTESFWDPVARAWYLSQLFMGVDWRPPLMLFAMATLSPLVLFPCFGEPRRIKAVLFSLFGAGSLWGACELTDGLWAWWMYGICRPLMAALGSGMPAVSFKDLVLVYGLPGAVHGVLSALLVLAVARAMRGRIQAHETRRSPAKKARPAKQDTKKN